MEAAFAAGYDVRAVQAAAEGNDRIVYCRIGRNSWWLFLKAMPGAAVDFRQMARDRTEEWLARRAAEGLPT